MPGYVLMKLSPPPLNRPPPANPLLQKRIQEVNAQTSVLAKFDLVNMWYSVTTLRDRTAQACGEASDSKLSEKSEQLWHQGIARLSFNVIDVENAEGVKVFKQLCDLINGGYCPVRLPQMYLGMAFLSMQIKTHEAKQSSDPNKLYQPINPNDSQFFSKFPTDDPQVCLKILYTILHGHITGIEANAFHERLLFQLTVEVWSHGVLSPNEPFDSAKLYSAQLLAKDTTQLDDNSNQSVLDNLTDPIDFVGRLWANSTIKDAQREDLYEKVQISCQNSPLTHKLQHDALKDLEYQRILFYNRLDPLTALQYACEVIRTYDINIASTQDDLHEKIATTFRVLFKSFSVECRKEINEQQIDKKNTAEQLLHMYSTVQDTDLKKELAQTALEVSQKCHIDAISERLEQQDTASLLKGLLAILQDSNAGNYEEYAEKRVNELKTCYEDQLQDAVDTEFGKEGNLENEKTWVLQKLSEAFGENSPLIDEFLKKITLGEPREKEFTRKAQEQQRADEEQRQRYAGYTHSKGYDSNGPYYYADDVKIRFPNLSAAPHELLEIDENADATTISKAFRKLVLKYHPDKNSSPETTQEAADAANKTMQEINFAYSYMLAK